MIRPKSTLIASVLAMLVLAVSLKAQTLVYVDMNATGANNGTSWEDAYHDLREALDFAVTNTIIRVADGTYSPGENHRDTFQLKNEVAVEGGYAGFGAPDPDERDIQLYETVLDGKEINNHVVNGSYTDETAMINGITITGGFCTDSWVGGGGGMLNENSDVTVIDCSFIQNTSKGLGGGVLNRGEESLHSAPTLIRCLFLDNSADLYSGGGVTNQYSNATLVDCVFTSNFAQYNGGGLSSDHSDFNLIDCTFINNRTWGFGGGIQCNYCNAMLSNCIFNENVALNSGGGVSNHYSTVQITDCTFSNNVAYANSAPAHRYGGGGVRNDNSIVSMVDCWFNQNVSNEMGGAIYNWECDSFTGQDCTLDDNQANMAGGGIYSERSSNLEIFGWVFIGNSGLKGGGMLNKNSQDFIISNCGFRNNMATEYGGGISNYTCDNVSLNGCAFEENVAQDGGGVDNYVSDLTMTNCLLFGNSALTKGAGIENRLDGYVSLINCSLCNNVAGEVGGAIHNYDSLSTATNSILWANGLEEINNEWGGASSVSYSCVRGGHDGEGNIAANPRFENSTQGDLHLSRYSPCINRGSNQGAPVLDFDGEARPYMGTVDMGAYECIDNHLLSTDIFILSRSTGGQVPFTLNAGVSQAGKWYVIVGSLSGTAPGLDLPGGKAILPINFDGFTNNVLNRLNTPVYANFLAVLDGVGSSSAQMVFQAGGFPVGWVGKTMRFAYTVDTFDMVSNPVQVEVLP